MTSAPVHRVSVWPVIKTLFWVLIASVLCTGLSVYAEVSETSIPLHHFDIACDNCHDLTPESNENFTYKETTINQGCSLVGCHAYDSQMSHPVGVKVKSIPEGIPLNSNSEITCITCHQMSIVPEVIDPNTHESNDTLVINTTPHFDLCSSCHAQSGGSLKKQSHWTAVSAHLVKLNPNTASETTLGMTEMVDAESRSCLSCHEDVSVSIPAFNGNAGYRNTNSESMSGHSIGVNYNRAQMRLGAASKYRTNLKKKIRLFDGNVGCGSCHSLYSKNHMNLVRENPKGELCMECHDFRR